MGKLEEDGPPPDACLVSSTSVFEWLSHSFNMAGEFFLGRSKIGSRLRLTGSGRSQQRKLKHSGHPAREGTNNVQCAMSVK